MKFWIAIVVSLMWLSVLTGQAPATQEGTSARDLWLRLYCILWPHDCVPLPTPRPPIAEEVPPAPAPEVPPAPAPEVPPAPAPEVPPAPAPEVEPVPTPPVAAPPPPSPPRVLVRKPRQEAPGGRSRVKERQERREVRRIRPAPPVPAGPCFFPISCATVCSYARAGSSQRGTACQNAMGMACIRRLCPEVLR